MTQEIVMSDEYKELLALSSGLGGFDDALGSGSSSAPPRVSIETNHFALWKDGGEVDLPSPLKLHFVCVGLKKPNSRVYYEGAYDPNEASPPACWSVDSVVPEDNATPPFLDSGERAARTCAECPKAVWGSARSKLTGSKIPACKEYKNVVIKVLGVDGIWLLAIPPKSVGDYWNPMVRQLQQYGRTSKTPVTMYSAVIEATFVQGFNGVVSFRLAGWVQGAEAGKVVSAIKDRDAITDMLWGSKERFERWQHGAAGKPPVDRKPETPPVFIPGEIVRPASAMPSGPSSGEIVRPASAMPSGPRPEVIQGAPVQQKRRGRPPANRAPEAVIDPPGHGSPAADFVSSAGMEEADAVADENEPQDIQAILNSLGIGA